ncbi:MAG TPA: hypothetical protein PLO16_15035 [Acidocella sp.]|nr:hypothetical protein [Acidocella sp.]
MPMTASLGDLFLDHVQESYAPLRSAPEYLARNTKVTPATAINWIRRRSKAQINNFSELCRNDPEFRAKAIAWLQQEHE